MVSMIVGSSCEGKTHDLSRIQPGHPQPAPGEECVENEQEHRSRNPGLGLSLKASRNRQHHHGQGHASSAN